MIKEEIIYITLNLYKKISKLKDITFFDWDEKFFSIIYTKNKTYIYDPSLFWFYENNIKKSLWLRGYKKNWLCDKHKYIKPIIYNSLIYEK